MTAFSADSIESTTVVGYQQTPTVGGFSCVGASFSAANGGDYQLKDFKPFDENGNVVEDWTCYISKMTAGGVTDNETTAVWMTAAGGSVAKDGWYDANDGETPKNMTFKCGEAFMLDSVKGGLQSAGAVNYGEITSPTISGFNALCNPHAVEININNIKPYDAQGNVVEDWTCYISKMTAGGVTDNETTAVWMTAAGGSVAKDGWYDANDGETPKPLTFKAGEGFMLDSIDGKVVFAPINF